MTDHYAVLGNPVAHSMSPAIHAFFAANLGDDISYDRLLVEEGNFDATASGFLANGRGCNVTVPCKGDAFRFADTLSEYAKTALAVNTLKKLDDGRIYGDNTDGRGFVADLKFKGVSLNGARVLILGAGGAARGILKPVLDEKPGEVVIANRTLSKAQELQKLFGSVVKAQSTETVRDGFDLVINATSASLSGSLPAIDPGVLSRSRRACDLMYSQNGETIFTEFARKQGCPEIFDGFGMLIMQAALSYELWRGRMPDFEVALKHFRKNS